MLQCSWDMTCERCNCFFHFGLFFSFYPSNSPKNRNFKKMNKLPGDIIILHICTKNHDHMQFCSWDMARDRCIYFFHFGLFLTLLFPQPKPSNPFNSPKNQNFKRKKKLRCLEISSFYTFVPKIIISLSTVPEIWCATDRRTGRRTTDGQKKWHIKVGAPPKSIQLICHSWYIKKNIK